MNIEKLNNKQKYESCYFWTVQLIIIIWLYTGHKAVVVQCYCPSQHTHYVRYIGKKGVKSVKKDKLTFTNLL